MTFNLARHGIDARRTAFGLLLGLCLAAAGCGRKPARKTEAPPPAPAVHTPAPADTNLPPQEIPGTEPMPVTDDMTALMALPQDDPRTQLNIGDLNLRQGRKREAVAAYRKALELNPRYTQAWNNLGLAQMRSGDSTSAEASFRKAIDIDSGYSKAFSNLGTLYLRQGRLQKGTAMLEMAVRNDSTDAIACSNLGHAYRRAGRDNDALRLYFKALEIDPRRAIDHFHAGNVYFDKRLWDDAYDRYRMAIELDPSIQEARMLMAKLEESNVLIRNKPKKP